jgi:hypothetical protein
LNSSAQVNFHPGSEESPAASADPDPTTGDEGASEAAALASSAGAAPASPLVPVGRPPLLAPLPTAPLEPLPEVLESALSPPTLPDEGALPTLELPPEQAAATRVAKKESPRVEGREARCVMAVGHGTATDLLNFRVIAGGAARHRQRAGRAT